MGGDPGKGWSKVYDRTTLLAVPAEFAREWMVAHGVGKLRPGWMRGTVVAMGPDRATDEFDYSGTGFRRTTVWNLADPSALFWEVSLSKRSRELLRTREAYIFEPDGSRTRLRTIQYMRPISVMLRLVFRPFGRLLGRKPADYRELALAIERGYRESIQGPSVGGATNPGPPR